MMNQYLFQTKSNHRFLNENKGVFLKEMNNNQMGVGAGVARQNNNNNQQI